MAPVAIVTGAGAGIGQATARMLHERGHRVVAADVTIEARDCTRGLADV